MCFYGHFEILRNVSNSTVKRLEDVQEINIKGDIIRNREAFMGVNN